jgi:hypothetical protein
VAQALLPAARADAFPAANPNRNAAAITIEIHKPEFFRRENHKSPKQRLSSVSKA